MTTKIVKEGGLIIVEIKIKGIEKIYQGNFVLDTGATYTTISKELLLSIDHLLSFLDKNIEVEEIFSLLLFNADMSKMINEYIHSTGMIYSQNAF